MGPVTATLGAHPKDMARLVEIILACERIIAAADAYLHPRGGGNGQARPANAA